MKRKSIIVRLGLTVFIIVVLTAVGFRLALPFLFAPECLDSTTALSSMDEIKNCISDTVQTHGLPGMAVAVVARGDVVWSTGVGFADQESRRYASPDTPYMLASTSKAVTGVAVMQALEQGTINLDANINDILPFRVDNPQINGEVITVRHLLTHTSGIRDHDLMETTYVSGDPDVSLSDFLEGYFVPGGQWYNADENFAAAEPGSTFSYSNVGMALAGFLIEAKTGIPFDDYCQEKIFDPLQMENTGWYLADFKDPTNIAVPYKDNKPLEQYGFYSYPDGQLRSSARDMGRFLAAVINGGELNGQRILAKSSVEKMLEPQFSGLDKGEWTFIYRGFEQGLAWTEQHGYYGHAGSDKGVSTIILFDKTTGVGVVILCNESNPAATIVTTRLADWILLHGKDINRLR